MFPFSQEMRFDQAALIPPASERGRGLAGAGSALGAKGAEKVGHVGAEDIPPSILPDPPPNFPEPSIRSVPAPTGQNHTLRHGIPAPSSTQALWGWWVC